MSYYRPMTRRNDPPFAPSDRRRYSLCAIVGRRSLHEHPPTLPMAYINGAVLFQLWQRRQSLGEGSGQVPTLQRQRPLDPNRSHIRIRFGRVVLILLVTVFDLWPEVPVLRLASREVDVGREVDRNSPPHLRTCLEKRYGQGSATSRPLSKELQRPSGTGAQARDVCCVVLCCVVVVAFVVGSKRECYEHVRIQLLPQDSDPPRHQRWRLQLTHPACSFPLFHSPGGRSCRASRAGSETGPAERSTVEAGGVCSRQGTGARCCSQKIIRATGRDTRRSVSQSVSQTVFTHSNSRGTRVCASLPHLNQARGRAGGQCRR